jgi:mono/diheme cytochrome c family protein
MTTVQPAATATGDVQAGKAIYERLCMSCHGPTGQGGRMAGTLAVRPRNLADQAYMSMRSDQQLFAVISQGGAATGLSAAMTAFGNQLAEQQIWDTVAYVRTLAVASSPSSASPLSATPSLGSASEANLVMARLRLSIWPEYDDPRVLIMWRGEMAPHQAFPAHITFPLPKGAEIVGAGMISDQNELLRHPYEILPGDTHDSLQLNLPVPRFFLEFYYNPFTASGAEKRFTYAMPTPYPIEGLEVDIQQPLKASNFTLDPIPMEHLTDQQGFTYHQFAYRDIAAGQPQTFTISYTKTVLTPSVPKQQPAPQRPRNVRLLSGNVLISLSILVGASIVFAGWAWLLRGSQPRHVPVTSSVPQPTPTPSEFLALLQEDAQLQDITDATSVQPQTSIVNFCAHCGHTLLLADHFCSGCGKPIQR